MKKLLMVSLIGFSTLTCVNAQTGPLNNTIIVNLSPSKKVPDHFYCIAHSDKITQVHMQNHSVMIGGFNADGEASFSGFAQLTKLNHAYFTAKIDPHKSSMAANVVIKFDGEDKMGLECFNGTDGRLISY